MRGNISQSSIDFSPRARAPAEPNPLLSSTCQCLDVVAMTPRHRIHHMQPPSSSLPHASETGVAQSGFSASWPSLRQLGATVTRHPTTLHYGNGCSIPAFQPCPPYRFRSRRLMPSQSHPSLSLPIHHTDACILSSSSPPTSVCVSSFLVGGGAGLRCPRT